MKPLLACALGRILNTEFERYGRRQSWPSLGYCLSICMERLRKATKVLSQVASVQAEI
jgi:hypothetical protein